MLLKVLEELYGSWHWNLLIYITLEIPCHVGPAKYCRSRSCLCFCSCYGSAFPTYQLERSTYFLRYAYPSTNSPSLTINLPLGLLKAGSGDFGGASSSTYILLFKVGL